jgi:hypothetical protein
MEIPDLVSAEAEEAGAERSGGALTRRRARSGRERMPFSQAMTNNIIQSRIRVALIVSTLAILFMRLVDIDHAL